MISEILVNLRRFIEKHCVARLCIGTQASQVMVVKGSFSSLQVMNKKLKVALKCGQNPL